MIVTSDTTLKKNLDPSWLIVTSDNLYITSSTLPLLCGLDQAQTGVF